MIENEEFSDKRNKAFCPYCGRTTRPRNKDHVPSRILLDKPYPAHMPIIFPCQKCNSDFSRDEEYVACLIECARIGSSDIRAVEREKIREALGHSPKMAVQISEGIGRNDFWSTSYHDRARIARIVLKLAMGHVAYELGEPILAEPIGISFLPINLMSHEQLASFETPPAFSLLAEVGSWAFQRQIESATGKDGWIIVQPGRYRYLTHFSDIALVRTVISEFLVCEVSWDLS
jgi:hypothetical protein